MHTSKYNNCLILPAIVLFVFFSFSAEVQAAVRTSESLGASGWSLPTSEYIGTDTTTCGASSTVGQVQLVEEGDETSISDNYVPSWQVTVQDKDGNIKSQFWNTGNISQKFCYQLSSDYVKAYTTPSPLYYEHLGTYVGMKPETPTAFYGQSYLGRVHLRTKNSGQQNIAPVFPLDSDNSSDPQYIMDTRSIPNIYNSTELLKTVHIVVDATSGARTQTILNSSGSSGMQTMPPLGLSDGFYLWGFFVALNGDETLSNGMHINNGVPVSGSTQPVFFTVDSTAPSTAVDLTLVSTTSTQVNVTIINDVQDLVSGTNYTTLYIKETSPGTSTATTQIPLFGSRSATRINVPVSLTPGSTYEYYAVTQDMAGNIATSTIKTYVAQTGGGPTLTTEITSPVSTITTANYGIEYGLSNNIDFDGESFLSSQAPHATIAWEWRLDNCLSGIIYSNEKSFSTSTVGNVLLGDGSSRTVYLRAQADSLGLPWSNNCPSVNITINCPSGEEWNGSSCIPVVATYPDLVSQNLKVSAGPYQMNDIITFDADVKNVGAENTILMSRSKFSYSWDGGANWVDTNASLTHGSIVVGDKVADTDSLILGQIGSLQLRHCVDTNNSIDEGPLGESPNCTIIGPLTVTNEPSATLSGSGCIIPNSGTASTCNGWLTWNIRFVNSANIYNLTNQTFYSHSLSGSNFTVPLQYGPNVIQARNFVLNTPNVLKQITLTASCETNVSFWDGAKCGPLPIIDISAIPATVRAGQSTAIKIGITSGYTFNCQLLGADTMTSDLTHTGGPTIQYYEFPTRKLYSAQIIKITCDVMGNNVEIDTRIDIVGSPFEV